MIVSMLGIGISAGVQPILGFCYGAKNKDRFMKFLKFSIIFTSCVCLVVALICFIFARPIVDALLNEKEAMDAGTNAVIDMSSTATGTALGTLIALTPILYPVGVAMGASPVVMAGALVSASYFGDNIAPVSDTTIASAVTQGSTLPKAVRARLQYAFSAAAVGCVLFFITGGHGVQTATDAAAYDPTGLVMLIVPAILIIMMFRDANLLVAILTSVAVGIVIALCAHLITPAAILTVDMDSFSVSGIVCDGISGMMDSAVFALLVMSIVHIVQDTGFLDMVIDKMKSLTKTDSSAEMTIGLISVILSFMTLANTVAIIIEGPMSKKVLVEEHKIAPERAAAILDAFSAAAMGLCPYAFAPLLAVVFAAGTGATMDFNAVQVCMHSYYNIVLLFVMIFAASTGWGRKKWDTDPQETFKPSKEAK